MSISANEASFNEASLGRDFARYFRYRFGGRRGLITAAIVLMAPALWLGWPWLVAAGLAPLIIAMAPCAVMCAVGACAMGGKSCKKSEADGAAASAADASSVSTAAAPKPLTPISSDSTGV